MDFQSHDPFPSLTSPEPFIQAESSQSIAIPDALHQWRVPPAADLRWREWDDDQSLVYHPPSGDTHLLNPLAAEALKLLERQPSSCAMLVEHVARVFALKAEGDLVRQIEQCLAQFNELGLIEPAHAHQ
jgi:PqqD family protein of HPr-rel-A system